MFDQKVGLIILVNKTLLLTQRIKILLFSESRIQCSFLRYTGLLTYFSSYRKKRGDYWVNHCDLDDMVLCGCFFLGVLFLSTWLIGIATQIRDQLKTCVKKPHCSKEEMALTSCQHICFYISSMGVGGKWIQGQSRTSRDLETKISQRRKETPVTDNERKESL